MTSSIRWIHFSDLHRGLRDQSWLWPSVREAFYDDLERLHERTGPWELVLFTGDLTQRGSSEEFELLTHTLEDLWRHFKSLGSTPLLVVVPGNHDLVRPDAKRGIVKLMRQWHDDPDIREGTFERGSEYLDLLKQVFRPFHDWSRAWLKAHPPPEGMVMNEGILPGDQAVVVDKEGLRLGIVGLNSAFLQLEGGDYKGRLGLHPRQIHAVCEGDAPAWVRRAHATLLLTHHPADWLHPWSHNAFLTDIAPAGRFLAHLYGHMHEPTAIFQRIGGAAPQRMIQAASLFGLETWGDDKEHRTHGYGVGRIDAERLDGRLLIEQRIAQKHVAGHWQLAVDTRWGIGGDGKFEESFPLRMPVGGEPAAIPARNATSPNEARMAEVARYRQAMAADRDRGHIAIGSMGKHLAGAGAGDLLRRFVVPRVVQDEGEQDLEVTQEAGQSSRSGDADAGSSRTSEPRQPRRPPEPADRLVFDEARPWSLVLGGPGAGKSALADWVLLKLCVPGEAPEGPVGALCPVRLVLRDLEQRHRRAQGKFDIFELLDAEKGSLGVATLRALATQGKVFWILDGLDEVVDPEERARWATRIGDLKRTYGGHGLITSRIVGSGRAGTILANHGIQAYRLIELDEERIRLWIKQWHESLTTRGPEQAAGRRQRLEQTLRERPHVAELCRNPLLLTLVAGLSGGGGFPTRRTELYGRVLENFVDAWETRKALDGGGAPTFVFDYGTKVRFLRELAWKMMNELPNGSGNVVSEQDLMGFAGRFCEEVFGEPASVAQRTARQLVEQLRHRNEILVFHGEDQFGFVHRALLDYLAAEEPLERIRTGALEQRDLGALFKKHWRQPEWQECLTLLAVQIADRWPERALSALQGLLRSEDLTEIVDMQFANVCVRGLAETENLEREPLRTFAVRLTELVLECSVHRSESTGAPGSSPRFVTELRLAGSRWPGAALIRQRALASQERDHRARAVICQMALATAPREDRVTLLRGLLEHEIDPEVFSAAVYEATLKGQWTSDELRTVRSLAETRGERTEIEVLSLLALSGDEGSIERLLALLRSSADAEVMLRAALFLADVPVWKGRPAPWSEEAIRALPDLVERCPRADPISAGAWLEQGLSSDATLASRLRGWLVSADDELRRLAMRLLAGAGDAGVVSLLEERVRTTHFEDWSAVFDLEQAAERSEQALAAIARILADRRLAEGERLLSLARWWGERVGPAEAGEALRAMALQGALDERLRIGAASELLRVSGFAREGQDLLLDLSRSGSTEVTRGMALQELHQDARHTVSPELLEATRAFLKAATTAERRCTAALWLVAQPAPDIQREGREVLREIARSRAPAAARLYAAVNLREQGDPTGSEVLAELADTAKPLSVRRDAAWRIQSEPALRTLAESAKDAQVRAAAQHDLALLEARRRLLRVGQLRRGIVLLAGQRVGVIEELSAGGTRFTYDPSWLDRSDAKAIAVSMPLRRAPYESEGLLPFFENLLPEGWLLDLARRKLGAAASDAFGLLLATCGDCAGAVEIAAVPEEQAA